MKLPRAGLAPALLALVLEASAQAPPAGGTRGAPPEAPPAAASASFGFRWGGAGSASVREIETLATPRGDVELVSTYRVAWAATPEGVIVSRGRRVFESLGGAPIPAGAVLLRERQLDDLLTPSVRARASGAFEAFGSAGEIDRLEAELEDRGAGHLAALVRAARSDAAAVRRARERARELWEAWCGAWIGASLVPGETREVHRPAYVGLGDASLPARVRVTCERTLEGAAEPHAQLTLRIAHVGGEVPALAASVQAAEPDDVTRGGVLRARQADLEGTFGIGTCRPERVRVVTTRVFADGAGGTRSEKDQREFVFDWTEGQGVRRTSDGQEMRW